MATLRIRYHHGVGPNQVQAPQNKISDEAALTINTEVHTSAVTEPCLAELSCDAICSVDYGPAANASAANGQRLPAGAYGYFLWLNKGDFISVIATT
jgi:hypothetical protein